MNDKENLISGSRQTNPKFDSLIFFYLLEQGFKAIYLAYAHDILISEEM